MPQVTGVLETALYVSDLDQAQRFYEDLFGFRLLLRDERMCGLSIAEKQVLLLFRKGGTTEGEDVPGGFIPPHDASGQIHLCFAIEADSLQSWRKILEEKQMAIESEVHPPRGGTSLYFRDLDNHLIELATPGIWEIY